MPLTRTSLASDIENELDTYFAMNSGNARPDFAAFLAAKICDVVQDSLNNYLTITSTPSLLDSVSGSVTGTVTTTISCAIP